MFEQVRKKIATLLGIDESKIKMQSRFTEDLKADSLDIVQMLIALEDDFGVEFSDDEINNWKTVGDIVKYLENIK
ncbi:MAG: acyl carrier protein [Clostridiales bacterium]|jgi:acyl carrier protein|nr:acyl carrier protein [Clostridiales bacterium]